jgi:hypothetical protein
MENRTIHKGGDRTNVPCQIAKPKTNELPESVEAEIEASYRASILGHYMTLRNSKNNRRED